MGLLRTRPRGMVLADEGTRGGCDHKDPHERPGDEPPDVRNVKIKDLQRTFL